jgi:hypothetical protein
MKPVTGQYECVHSSGIGLDYFTARIDALTLFADGRFTLKVQQRSRAIHAAQAFVQGQQVNSNAPETVMEGTYMVQGANVQLSFANGGFENAQLDPDGNGIAIGPNHFNKVSDSTSLPPTHRLQQNMDDIAKGLKIASTLGGMAVKAAKTIQSTVQSVQSTPSTQSQSTPTSYGQNAQPAPAPHAQPQPVQPQPVQPQPQPGTLYCDQCGAHVRPGKRFCNNCGARLA